MINMLERGVCFLHITLILRGNYIVSIHKWLFSAISASNSDFSPRNTQMYSCGQNLRLPWSCKNYLISGWTLPI